MEELIISFNLRLNVKSDLENAWPNRMESVIKYLNDKKPLIVGTQEAVDSMIDDFNNYLYNYNHIGVSRSDDKVNGEYCSILYDKTRLKVRAFETLWISETPYLVGSIDYKAAYPRIITWGEFYFKDNTRLKFRVYNTHLDNVSPNARLEGVKLIKKLIDEHNKKEILPSIILGDFNCTIFDEPIMYLLKFDDFVYANEFISNENYGTTYHDFKGITQGHPIDHIFTNNLIQVNTTFIFKEKIDNKYLSDHYPLEAYIEFIKE